MKRFSTRSQQSSAHNRCSYSKSARGDRGKTPLAFLPLNNSVQIDPLSSSQKEDSPSTQSKLRIHHPIPIVLVNSRIIVNSPPPRGVSRFEFPCKNHVSVSFSVWWLLFFTYTLNSFSPFIVCVAISTLHSYPIFLFSRLWCRSTVWSLASENLHHSSQF